MRLKPLALAAALGLFFTQAHASPETEFWKWFQKNQDMLYNFESDQERIFDKLADQMHRIDPNLTFEFGPKLNQKREFVISADGFKASFPKVESLYAAAPNLSKWTITKFRPRREPFNIRIGDIEVTPEDVSIIIEQAGPKPGLLVFISGYTPARKREFMNIAFLLMDQALGEFDMETKVGDIEVRERTNIPKNAISLEALPATFDEVIQSQL